MTETPRAEHSEWGASSAHRWWVCAGSIALSRGITGMPSVYAEEGTVAHHVGEACLRDPSLNPGDFIGKKLKGQHMEIEVTEEMAEAVDLYVKTVRTERLLTNGKMLIEQQFDLNALVPKDLYADYTDPKTGKRVSVRPSLFGRNDCCIITPDGHLIVFDYKHGRGHAVEVEMNPQLLYYALGALLRHERARVNRIRSVEIVIVQPRAVHKDGPVRRFTISLIDLQEWAADLIAAVKRTVQPDAANNLVVGDHCTFCRAAAVCPARVKHATQGAMIDFSDYRAKPPAPETLTLKQIQEVLEKADLVEEFIAAVRTHAHQLMKQGVSFPGWKLVLKRPYRKFTIPEPELVALLTGNDFGFSIESIYSEPALKSVAQIEALCSTKEKKELLAKYWIKESSGTVIARDSDPRPALPPPAVSDFAQFAIGSQLPKDQKAAAASILD